MKLETVKLTNEKELESKIEAIFKNKEKNKIYFLKKFLKKLEAKCKQSNFICKKEFSKNKIIIKLDSKILQGEESYLIYLVEKGIKIVSFDRDDLEHLEDNLVPFKKDKISNDFLFNYCEYPGIFFRTLEKTIVEEKLKENPKNYALKEYFYVLKKIHFDFRIHTKFKISELLEAKAYPKLLEEKYKIKLRKKYRRIPIELLDFMLVSNLKEEDEFILDFLNNKSEKSLNVIEKLSGICHFPKFHFYFFAEFLGLSEKLNIDLVRISKRFDKARNLYFKNNAERNFFDTVKMLKDVEIKNVFQKILKFQNPYDLEKFHDKIIKKYNQKKEIPERKISISEDFNKIIKSFEDDKELSFLKLINNEKELYDEGIKQGNCVYSYLKKIEDGDCIIFSGKYKNINCTIEIVKFFNSFYCIQCFAKYNKENLETEELKEIIEDKLRIFNAPIANKLYNGLKEALNL